MGVTRADGYCLLACSTTSMAVATAKPVDVDFGPTYDLGSSSQSQGQSQGQSLGQGLLWNDTRVLSSRAVRVTLDPMGVSPRMLRVYYSPDEDFANLALAVAVEAPQQLQAAENATVGFSSTGVRSLCLMLAVCVRRLMWSTFDSDC